MHFSPTKIYVILPFLSILPTHTFGVVDLLVPFYKMVYFYLRLKNKQISCYITLKTQK
jgi:hypothetical protein